MAFDGMFCIAAAHELDGWAGARIEKIHQSSASCMYFQIYREGVHGNMVISASASRPIISVGDESVARPDTPTSLCMLYRKHLQNGKLVSAEAVENERIIKICFSSADEMGYIKNKYLYAEMMGKYSNLILTEEDGKIICASSVTDITSSGRRIMAGMPYELPKKQDKIPVFQDDEKIFDTVKSGIGTEASSFLLKTFFALSPLAARQIAFDAVGRTDAFITEGNAPFIAKSVLLLRDKIKNRDFTPNAVYDKDGKGIEYSYIPITQYGSGFEVKNYGNFSDLLNDFYGRREEAVNINRYSHAVVQSLNTHIQRARKKLSLLTKEYGDCDRADGMRIKGDVITANIYRIKRGDESFTGTDYESGKEIRENEKSAHRHKGTAGKNSCGNRLSHGSSRFRFARGHGQ